MKTISLDEYTNLTKKLEQRFSDILENVWDINEIDVVDSSIDDKSRENHVRKISQMRVYFNKEIIEEKTGIDEFDIVDCYFDALAEQFVIRCFDDEDTEKLVKFLGEK